MLDLKQFLYHITCRDFNTSHCFCDITHQCFAGKKLKNLNFSASGIYPVYIPIILRAGTSIYASILGFWPSGAKTLRGKNLNFSASGIYPVYIPIILRAGTSIYASSGFGPLGPKPCGGKNDNIQNTITTINIITHIVPLSVP